MPGLIDRLKVPVLTVFISLLLLFGFTKIFGPIPFTVNSINTENTNLFTVDGTGEATGTPDSAQFTVGVTKTAATVETAQSQANTAVNKIVAGLKAQGIDDKDIKTENYNVNPNIDYANGSQNTTGYTVSTNITVTLKDAKKANTALDSATANGANVVNGVSFTLNDDEKMKLEDEARGKAIANAKAQAEKIANQSGIRLGRLINVMVNPTDQGPLPMTKAFDAAAGQAIPDRTELQPGENKVIVNVTLSYETR